MKTAEILNTAMYVTSFSAFILGSILSIAFIKEAVKARRPAKNWVLSSIAVLALFVSNAVSIKSHSAGIVWFIGLVVALLIALSNVVLQTGLWVFKGRTEHED